MHYETHGEGEPLLLLHGLGSSTSDWEHQVPTFSEKFHVIAPSLRGFGETDKPSGPYSMTQYANDAFALLDHLNIKACHVLGFSMGGAIAFQMAVQNQHRVHTLTILNSQPGFEVDHWSKHLFVLSRIAMAKIVGMERMARFLSKRLFPEPNQEHLRNTMRIRHGTNDKDSYLAALNALKGWNVREWIAGLHMPTLVVAAEHDYTSIEDKKLFVSELPNARLEVIEGSRHATHVDRSQQFNELVMKFLLDHPVEAKRRSALRWLGGLKRMLSQESAADDHGPPKASA